VLATYAVLASRVMAMPMGFTPVLTVATRLTLSSVLLLLRALPALQADDGAGTLTLGSTCGTVVVQVIL